MKSLVLNNIPIEIYDSIEEMPIVNFQKYNKYVLIDSGLGSDIEDIDEHLVNLAKLIKTDLKKATQELQNMRQSMYMIVNEISPKYMAFAAIIHSFDGKKVTDLSEDNLKAMLAKLQFARHSSIIDLLIWVKKKVFTELETYFPQDFGPNAKEKEVFDKLKQRVIYKLQGIIKEEQEQYAEKVAEIDNYLFGLYKPENFNGTESAEVKYDKQFEASCMLISQKANMNAKKMTVLEFYSTLSNLQKQAEAEAKAYKKFKKR